MANFEIFESLGGFSRALNTRPANKYYTKDYEEHSHKEGRADWCGTPDYQTADKLLLNGDKGNAAKVQTALNTRLRLNGGGRTPQNMLYNSVQGFAPNMGRLMSGHPENMLNIRRTMRDNSKVITIIYNLGVPGIVRAENIINAGAKLLAAIKQLEKSEYRCSLYVGFCAHIQCAKKIKTKGAFVKVKDAGKMLDITRLAYTFANPSFLRRHILAYIERIPDAQDSGYGRPATGPDVKNVLTADGPKFDGAYYVDFSLLDSCTDTQNVINALKENRL